MSPEETLIRGVDHRGVNARETNAESKSYLNR